METASRPDLSPQATARPTPEDLTLADRAFDRSARRLMPFLIFCYLAAFFDRINVGFAGVTMRDDIGLSATAFGLGSGVFFISYFLLEVPSNLALSRFGVRLWISRIMITWGLISGATAFVWDSTSFLAVRLLLGAAEAGFYPGILIYLTQWFPNAKRAQIVAILLLANPLASILGGPISGVILTIGDVAGLHGWQWLFIIEALPAVALGIAFYFFVPERVEDAEWLSPSEIAAARRVLDADLASRKKTASVALSQIFTHPHVLALALIFLGISMTNATVNFWLPQMIRQSGFSYMGTGLLSAVPYVAAVGGLMIWGRRSDRANERRFHLIAPLVLAIVGVSIAAFGDGPFTRVIGLTISATGLFASLPVFWTLPAQLMVGTAAAGGVAVINSIGNLGGLIGPTAMGYIKDVTGSFAGGLMVTVVMLCISVTTVAILTRNLVRRSEA